MLGNTIGLHRRKLGMTQEQLAQRLEVTNQAVSKWETDQCCPDVQLLPKLADVLGISMDTLFGRAAPAGEDLPWGNDDAFHIVMYHGHQLIGSAPAIVKEFTFQYDGAAKDVYCALNLSCEDVEGDVHAEGPVECGDVGGSVNTGDYVECGDVGGHVSAGGYVECGDINGIAAAGTQGGSDNTGGFPFWPFKK